MFSQLQTYTCKLQNYIITLAAFTMQSALTEIAPLYFGKSTTVFPEVQPHAVPGEPLYSCLWKKSILSEEDRYIGTASRSGEVDFRNRID